MIKIIKNLYRKYKTYFKIILILLGIIGVFDWVIAPGLTAKNTLMNIISLISLLLIILYIGVLVYELFFNKKKD